MSGCPLPRARRGLRQRRPRRRGLDLSLCVAVAGLGLCATAQDNGDVGTGYELAFEYSYGQENDGSIPAG